MPCIIRVLCPKVKSYPKPLIYKINKYPILNLLNSANHCKMDKIKSIRAYLEDFSSRL